MANVFVGFHDQRNSSRVLKPPGGGTSDIFGTDAPKIPKNDIVVASSVAKNDTNTTNIAEKNNKISNEENSKNGTSAENGNIDENINDISKLDSEEPKIENLNITDENKEKLIVTENVEENHNESKTEIKASVKTESISSIIHKEKQVNEPEKRTNHRVPPGGYSSGLW